MTAARPLPRLSRAQLETSPPRAPIVGPSAAMLALPEKAVQFGTGAFLRGFVDAFLDAANAGDRFRGRVVAVGSTGSGRTQAFAEQDGLYTLVSRGLVRGTPQEELRVVSAVSRALSADDDWDAVLECARNPGLELVFSNTTEVGFSFDGSDHPDDAPPRSFPGKITRFLHERARTFAFAPSKGLIVLPCELLDDNGDALRRLVLDVAAYWGYEPGFARWVESSVTFCNTLVDRIVPGAPRGDDAERLRTLLGYDDGLLTTAESFRLFVIEGDDALRERLGFADADPAIVVAPDIAAYRERKVRVLNGAHTISVTAALLAGCETVADAVQHPQIGAFLRQVVLEELAPLVDAPDAAAYASTVLQRFGNPYVQHALIDITMHGTTKLRVRVVPTVLKWAERRGRVPEGVAFGFASHLAYLCGEWPDRRRETGRPVPADELGDRIRTRWQSTPTADRDVREFVRELFADTSLWGTDLAAVPGFADRVAHHLVHVRTDGIGPALDAMLAVASR